MTSAEPPDLEPAAVPAPSATAVALFGGQLPIAVQYAELLAGDGVAHGHIGPREVDRLWSRHLVNSALLADLLPIDARFVDVGTGAGLPALPMVIRRPDLHAMLVEPMQRRCDFLTRAVNELQLSDRVTVVRGRADDPIVRSTVVGVEWVVARAVAPLDRLMRWCLPLLGPGGRVLALKGESAGVEIEQHRQTVARIGGAEIQLLELTAPASVPDVDVESTWVVSVRRQTTSRGKSKGRR